MPPIIKVYTVAFINFLDEQSAFFLILMYIFLYYIVPIKLVRAYRNLFLYYIIR